MKVLFIHVSDIHIKDGVNKVLQESGKLASSCYCYLPEVQEVFFIITGDIAFSGKREQYNAAEDYFHDVANKLKKEKDIPVRFIACPGNHDCDFDEGGSVRNMLLESLRKTAPSTVDDEVLETCAAVQKEYELFSERFLEDPVSSGKLFKRYEFDLCGSKLVFVALNFSWMSSIKERQGELVFPVGEAEKAFQDLGDVNVTLIHHPLSWLSQSHYHELKSVLRRYSTIIMSGHEHSQLTTDVNDSRSDQCCLMESGAFQHEPSSMESEFSATIIDLGEMAYLPSNHAWSEDLAMYIKTHGSEEWSTYRDLPCNKTPHQLSKDFLRRINDVGGNFIHPEKSSLSRSDVFVFPDLKREEVEADEKRYLDSRELVSGLGKVVLKGGESSGKTYLLYEFFLRHHERGLLPVYFSCLGLSSVSKAGLDKKLRQAVSEQYGNGFNALYEQSSKAKKIVYIDDLDQVRGKGENKAKVLDFFVKRYENIYVATGEGFEYSELSDPEMADIVGDFDKFEILPFGHQLRHSLIKKWSSISSGNDLLLDDGEKLIETERALNVVVGKHLVPSTPFYLLTLLQSFESAQDSGIQNSGYGYYYQFLITSSLKRASIKPDQLDEIFNYCSHLAYEFMRLKKSELSLREFEKFNDLYSVEYTRVDLRGRLKELIQSKVLDARGEVYSFSYSYIYYFFLGKYLADRWGDEDVEVIVDECCKHLYVKDNVHTVMFLTHHTNRVGVISKIQSVASSIFSSSRPISFNGDTTFLNDFVDETSRIVVEDVDTEKSQNQERKAKDEIYANGDPFEYTERLPELDIQAKIILMFKTVEILGVISKNYYGSLKNSFKKEIVSASFEAPLRALKGLFEALERDQEPLLNEISRLIEEEGEVEISVERSEVVARKFLFDVIGMVSFSFINKAASSMSSHNLMDVISDVVEEDGSVSYKLIELSAKLEMPGGIPFGRIEELAKTSEGNHFSKRLLESIVIKHLYMYRTSDSDKQRLSQILGFDLKKQRELSYQRSKERKVS